MRELDRRFGLDTQLHKQSQMEVAAQPYDHRAACIDAHVANLVAEHRLGHFIDLDLEYYKSYVRPRLRVFPDPAAAALMCELDRRFGLA